MPKPVSPQISFTSPYAKKLAFDFPFFERGGIVLNDTLKANKGAIVSGTPWTKDLFGPSLSFNGSSQKVTHNAFALSAGEPFVFQALINTGTDNTDVMGVRSGDPVQSGKMTQMRVQGNKIEFNHDFLADTTNNKATSATSVTDSKWHNIICQYTGSQLQVYVDGKLDGVSGTLTTLALTLNTNWTIATRSDFSAEWFNGKIALVRAWKGRAFAPREVTALYTDPFRIYKKPVFSSLNTGVFR